MTGAVAGSMNHDEYGRVIGDTIQGLVPFGYAGGLYDGDTGLVRFGVRDYDPEVGRWTSKDPVLFAGGDSNVYAYAFDDPINWADASGYQGSNQGADIDKVVSVDPDDSISQFAKNNLYNDNNVIDYVQHGLDAKTTPASVAKQRAESIAEGINNYLKNDFFKRFPKAKRKNLTIRLWVCQSATTSTGKEGDIAQVVANRTGMNVMAPTDDIAVAGQVIEHTQPDGKDVTRTPWKPDALQTPSIQVPKFR